MSLTARRERSTSLDRRLRAGDLLALIRACVPGLAVPGRDIRPGRDVSVLVLIGIAYLGAAALGRLCAVPELVGLIFWPASGVALAATLRMGNRALGAIAIAALADSTLAGLPTAGIVAGTLGPVVDAWLGAQVVLTFTGARAAPRRAAATLGLLVCAALTATPVTPTLSIAALIAEGAIAWGSVPVEWLHLWGAGALGAMGAAPLALTLGALASKVDRPRGRRAELWAFWLALILIGVLMLAVPAAWHQVQAPIRILFLAMVVYAGLRLDINTTHAAVLVVSSLVARAMAQQASSVDVPMGSVGLVAFGVFVTSAAVLGVVARAASGERSAAEAALRLSRALFREVVDTQTELVCRARPDTAITFANDAFCEYFNTPRELLLGRLFLDFIPDASRDRIADLLVDLSGTPRRAVIELQVADVHGAERWQEWIHSPIFDRARRLTEFQLVGRDVTDRKLAELSLQESEERFRTLANIAPVLIWQTDAQGQCTYFNQRWLDVTGRSAEQELGNGWLAGLHPDDRARVEEVFGDAVAHRRAYRMQFRLRDATGRYRHILESGVPRIASDGTFRGHIGSAIDTTEQIEAQQSLAFQKALLESEAEASIDGILVVALDGGWLHWNHRYLEMWGLGVSDGNPGSSSVLGAVIARQTIDPDAFIAGVRAYHEQPSLKGHDEIRLKDGRVLDRYTAPVTGEGGNIYGRAWYYRDITTLRRTEQSLVEQDSRRREADQHLRRYEAIVSSSSECMAFLDPRQIHLAVNDAYQLAFAAPGVAVVGCSLSDVFGPATVEAVFAPQLQACWRGDHMNVQVWLDSRNQGRRYWDLLFHRHVDAAGNIAGFVLVARDISELNRVHALVRASRDRLRKLTERLNTVREMERQRLARELHDEFGQLLTRVKMDVTALVSKAEHALYDESERVTGLLTRLDNALHAVRRITHGLRPPILDDFGLEVAIESEAKEFATHMNIRKLRLDLRAGELPRHADRDTAVFRIFQEAMTNVVRHAAATEVCVSLCVLEHHLVLTVEDDGRGITDEHIDSSDSLGILGMRERAGALGGRLHIRTREAGGTVVRLRVPLLPAPGVEVQP